MTPSPATPSGLLARVRTRSWGEWCLAAEAAAALTCAASLRVLTFRRVVRLFRLTEGEGVGQVTSIQAHRAGQVVWAIEAVGRRTPWTSTCLMKALAGGWLLRRRHVSFTLYLGVARSEPGGRLVAHAWLGVGDRVVLGGAARPGGYTPVASYSSG